MARIFITRRLAGDAIERLAAAHEIELWEGELPPDRDRLIAGAREADGMLCLLTDRIDAELLDAAPRLRAVANYAVGTDNIDLAECRRRNVAVGNTPGVLTEATADLTFALILATARRLPEAADAVEAGEWRSWGPRAWLGSDVGGATLGIIGAGAIGEAVARRAAGFGMEVLRSGRPGAERPDLLPLSDLLERSDFVSLHCPLTEETRGLIGADELAAMRSSAILINTARGEIVDTEALREALEHQEIAGAGLDVTDPEPLPSDHPLLGAPNLIVLPHIGSASVTARSAMADLAADNLLAALAGEPMPHAAL